MGAELTGDALLSFIGTLTLGETPGTDTEGDRSARAMVSTGAGAGAEVELQPGLAKIRIKANTWMPTTTPRTFMIFIGKIGWLVLKGCKSESYFKLAATTPGSRESFSNRAANPRGGGTRERRRKKSREAKGMDI